jgi:hypothetical protein
MGYWEVGGDEHRELTVGAASSAVLGEVWPPFAGGQHGPTRPRYSSRCRSRMPAVSSGHSRRPGPADGCDILHCHCAWRKARWRADGARFSLDAPGVPAYHAAGTRIPRYIQTCGNLHLWLYLLLTEASSSILPEETTLCDCQNFSGHGVPDGTVHSMPGYGKQLLEQPSCLSHWSSVCCSRPAP